MSAVSMKVTPRSRARPMVAIDSSQSVAPYHSLIPMQPRPWADTVRSPSLVVRMCVRAPCLGFQAASVVGDLRVEQLQAIALAGARPDQPGVTLHVPHR